MRSVANDSRRRRQRRPHGPQFLGSRRIDAATAASIFWPSKQAPAKKPIVRLHKSAFGMASDSYDALQT
jgi:hypothetical protein